jgi:O-acetyl-ADP-ribose deacetylase (regulator of RNase III)
MTVLYRPADNIVDGTSELLVNTVNCVGVMGKGVALAFKTRFPGIMPAYQQACRSKALRPGTSLILPLPGLPSQAWVAMATKDHWRDPSRLAWVEAALDDLARRATERGVRSIALPPPGCGNGGLDWRIVEPLVLDKLRAFDLTIHARPNQGV